jgi:superfamily I DNA/RNA helicase
LTTLRRSCSSRAPASPLFELRWPEFAQEQLDPEVPGLRSPQRFLQSAFRLIRRLGDASVDPALFLSLALSGATEFYANPPNFTDPSLLIATKNTFHDSLDVSAQELARQYRREVDLAKIIAKLYEAYVQLVGATGRMTGRDAVVAATRALREDRELAAQLRERHRFVFVDDAQELTDAEVQLLRAIFGEALGGVTLCGDPESAISMVRRTQPETTFAHSDSRVELRVRFRSPRIDVYRPPTALDEAAFVAQRVGEWIAQGVSAQRIAVIFRSVRNVELYEAALLDANIPVVISGDVNIFADRRALDALALLWNAYDPFRARVALAHAERTGRRPLRRLAGDALRRTTRPSAAALCFRRRTGANHTREPLESKTGSATWLERDSRRAG